jgi:hypothetical protein
MVATTSMSSTPEKKTPPHEVAKALKKCPPKAPPPAPPKKEPTTAADVPTVSETGPSKPPGLAEPAPKATAKALTAEERRALGPQVGINKWINLNDETQMMAEWPQLLECFGLQAVKDWRAALRKHSPALVHLLTGKNKAVMLEHAVEAGLNPDVQRGDGCTCLHIAAWTMNRELARVLEKLGASEAIANQYGELPKDVWAAAEKDAQAKLNAKSLAEKAVREEIINSAITDGTSHLRRHTLETTTEGSLSPKTDEDSEEPAHAKGTLFGKTLEAKIQAKDAPVPREADAGCSAPNAQKAASEEASKTWDTSGWYGEWGEWSQGYWNEDCTRPAGKFTSGRRDGKAWAVKPREEDEPSNEEPPARRFDGKVQREAWIRHSQEAWERLSKSTQILDVKDSVQFGFVWRTKESAKENAEPVESNVKEGTVEKAAQEAPRTPELRPSGGSAKSTPKKEKTLVERYLKGQRSKKPRDTSKMEWEKIKDFPTLLDGITEALDMMWAEDFPRALYCLATLRRNQHAQKHTGFELLVVEMLEVMEEFSPAELSTTAWSLAAMQCTDYRGMFTVVSSNALPIMDQFTAKDLSMLAWAYATLGVRDDMFMTALAFGATKRMADFCPDQLSTTAWAFAKLRLPMEPLFLALAEETLLKIDAFTIAEVSGVAWAFAKLGMNPPGGLFFERLAQEAVHQCNPHMSKAKRKIVFPPRDIAHLATACHFMGVQSKEFYLTMYRATLVDKDDFTKKEISMVVEALSEHGFLTHATNLTKQRRDVDDKAPLAKALVEEQLVSATGSSSEVKKRVPLKVQQYQKNRANGVDAQTEKKSSGRGFKRFKPGQDPRKWGGVLPGHEGPTPAIFQ